MKTLTTIISSFEHNLDDLDTYNFYLHINHGEILYQHNNIFTIYCILYNVSMLTCEDVEFKFRINLCFDEFRYDILVAKIDRPDILHLSIH